MQEKEITNTTVQQQVSTAARQQINESASQPIGESVNQSTHESINQSFGFDNAGSLFSAFPSGTDNSLTSDEIEEQKLRKITKKKKGRRMS